VTVSPTALRHDCIRRYFEPPVTAFWQPPPDERGLWFTCFLAAALAAAAFRLL
jgi:hypothetical protein